MESYDEKLRHKYKERQAGIWWSLKCNGDPGSVQVRALNAPQESGGNENRVGGKRKSWVRQQRAFARKIAEEARTRNGVPSGVILARAPLDERGAGWKEIEQEYTET